MTRACDQGPWGAVVTIFRGLRRERPLSLSAFRRCCVALCSALAHSLPCPGLPWSPPSPKLLKQTQTSIFSRRSLPKHKGDFSDQKGEIPNGDQSPIIGTVQSTFHPAEIETRPENSCRRDLHPAVQSPTSHLADRGRLPKPQNILPSSTTGAFRPTTCDTRLLGHFSTVSSLLTSSTA